MSMWQDIAKFGKKLLDRGLIELHFGNISIRKGGKMIITRTGIALDEINEDSIIEVDIDKPSISDAIASSESIVHRAIYKSTPALAIIHAHSPFAVIESLLAGNDIIVPLDIEGKYILHEIPIVRGDSGTPELAENVARVLKDRRGAIVLGHGTFTAGTNLDEAYGITALIEHSCKLRYYYDLARR